MSAPWRPKLSGWETGSWNIETLMELCAEVAWMCGLQCRSGGKLRAGCSLRQASWATVDARFGSGAVCQQNK
jgi:hypothetical protein